MNWRTIRCRAFADFKASWGAAICTLPNRRGTPDDGQILIYQHCAEGAEFTYAKKSDPCGGFDTRLTPVQHFRDRRGRCGGAKDIRGNLRCMPPTQELCRQIGVRARNASEGNCRRYGQASKETYFDRNADCRCSDLHFQQRTEMTGADSFRLAEWQFTRVGGAAILMFAKAQTPRLA